MMKIQVNFDEIQGSFDGIQGSFDGDIGLFWVLKSCTTQAVKVNELQGEDDENVGHF